MTDRATLQTPGTLWLAADIHLGADTPGTTAAFASFLHQAADSADALFLVGDIFDAWLGDDLATDHPPSWLQPILLALKATSQQISLYIGRGNRDFLMGEALAQHVGAKLLPDCVRLNTDAGSLLVSHGDEYCTQDKAYQRFRRLVRHPSVQQWFLNRPLTWRQAIANRARQRSRRANLDKPVQIMDVTQEAVTAALAASGCETLVHGHTHRPGVHNLVIDGQPHQRIVLPDWLVEVNNPIRGGWLHVDKQGATLHYLPGAAQSVPLQSDDPSH